MTGITIRLAERRDLVEVRDLLVTTWHDTYDPLIGADKVTEITNAWHSVDALGSQLDIAHASFLIAETEDRIVGHAFVNALRLPMIVLGRLYVRPGDQRRGIGKRLLDVAIARYPEAKAISLKVEADNLEGINFYRREGFVAMGEDIEEGLRHFRMERLLKGA